VGISIAGVVGLKPFLLFRRQLLTAEAAAGGKVGGVTKARAQPHPASVVQNLEPDFFFLGICS